ncbi:MAG: endonuclease/exonuclease/phosphatase family protein [Saprospiraceae bacterium]|nr:endonuclease/exonuclease/phosphatase family protein [Saprospiraceae bacterium]
MGMKMMIMAVGLMLTVVCAAQKQYKISSVGFYNLENLFDYEDDPLINDEEYTPSGSKLWTKEMYESKSQRMAEVIAQLSVELNPDGVAILGVAEIENKRVLEDLVKQPKLAARNYQIVHYDSPDRRGIDVGLLYQPKYFQVTGSRPIPLLIYEADSSRIFTRDILYVSGVHDNEPLHILVNHWPSRRGGEQTTRALREAGAAVCKSVVDSLTALDPNVKVIIMGDLNDDPVNASVRKVLQCEREKEAVEVGKLYNPMENYFRRGIGTLAYNDAWNLFDQIILSPGLVKGTSGYTFYKSHIFNEPFLVQKSGQFKGYPLRTHAGDNYLGGYSDHFPVYVFLVKEQAQ